MGCSLVGEPGNIPVRPTDKPQTILNPEVPRLVLIVGRDRDPAAAVERDGELCLIAQVHRRHWSMQERQQLAGGGNGMFRIDPDDVGRRGVEVEDRFDPERIALHFSHDRHRIVKDDL